MLGKVPTLTRKNCIFCGRLFTAGRKDTFYCTERCRRKKRAEDSHFKFKTIPKSGIKGITFKRLYGGWEVKIKIENEWKYIGVKKSLKEAIQFQKEVLNVPSN